MALIVRIAVLLGALNLCKTQIDASRSTGPQKKDARYGRPVLAMANSPRCMFNGRPVEDGRSVSSPEPCLNCTCSKGILLCYLRTCSTIVATPECEVVRRKGECCPKLECQGTSEIGSERPNEPSYKYRLRQDESSFFGLLGMDPRTEKSNYRTTTTTKKPAPKLNYNQDDWLLSKINSPSSEDQLAVEQEEDYESDQLSNDRNNSAGYCYHKGYKYSEGMAMLSPTKCEYCYCIRGQQMCVRPKCHLNIDGCVARYQSGYTCCPSHYQCEIGAGGVDTDRFEFIPSSKPGDAANKVSSCNVEGYDFDVGVAVPSSGHCQTCYCTQMGVVCRRLECSPTVPGCTPIVPEGHCCPTEYKCDQQNASDTKAPISHSTENYDVTIISPSGTEENTSSQNTESETTEVNYDDYDNHTTESNEEETNSNTVTDKQKITVELNDESNLESISVIPEENIAVLVVTTEKVSNGGLSKYAEETSTYPGTTKMEPDTISPSYMKQKIRPSTARSSTTVSDGTLYSQDSTKPIIISLPNLKQKTKPTTISGTTLITHGTKLPQDTTRPYLIALTNMKQKTKTSTAGDPSTEGTQYNQYVTKPSVLSSSNLKHKTKSSPTSTLSTTSERETTEVSTPSLHSLKDSDSSTESTIYTTSEDSDYNGEEKDYAYDYVELYEDVTHDAKETFSPFSDYSEPTFGERISSTEKTQAANSNSKSKLKKKKPPNTTQTRNPTIPTTSKFPIGDLKNHRITETVLDRSTHSTIPVTETTKSTENPTRYTIYSASSEKNHRPYITESTLKPKQKVKTSRPALMSNTKIQPTTLKNTTPNHSTTSEIMTRTYQNGEGQTLPDHTFDILYRTELYRPSSQYMKQPTVITSNHKQKPQRFSETTLPYKSTKPLPHEIAELLWTITHNRDTSTETYDPSTKQNTFISSIPENVGYFSDNLSSLVLAAPKLIVEDTTAEESHGTLQFETTNSDTPTSESIPAHSGSPPGLIFKVPEIIFSNHGPASHRKQPQPVRQSGQQTIGDHGQQPVRDYGLQPVRDYNQKPVRDHGQHPVRDHSQQPVRDYSQQPVRDHSQQPVRDHSQQPVRDHSQQPVRDHSQQPVRDYSQQPVRDYSQQPVRDHSQQPVRDHSQQPVRDHSQQPVRDHSQQPVRDHSQQPVRDNSQQPVLDYGKQPPRDSTLQTARKPGQQVWENGQIPVRESNLQTVRQPGKQPIREPGKQPVRDSDLQAVKQPGQQPAWENNQHIVKEPGLQTMRQPGQQPVWENNQHIVKEPGLQTMRQPGQQPVWENNQHIVKEPGLQTIRQPGKHPSRNPDPPMEINNHKKTLRPRPPVRMRPTSPTSIPQSTLEISNHRPINTFRRPPGNFPPYPSYNQRSETGYRTQPNPRDPHHSLHRIAPDLHPEWREDYDEYYYDVEQGRSPSTKVFTNMQSNPTTGGDVRKNTDVNSESLTTNLQPTTRQQDLSFYTNKDNNYDKNQDETIATPVYISGETTSKTANYDAIEGRSSYDKLTETTDQTFSTTPYPSTKQNIYTTTEYFQKDPVAEEDVKLSRAEDNNKENEASFIDRRYQHHEGKPNKFVVIDGRPSAEKPVLKPISAKPNPPSVPLVEASATEEDSKEISDVCFVDGRYYNSGEIIVKSNPCEMCRCFYGHPLCQVQQCPSPPEPSCVLEYLPGYCCPRVTCGVKMDSQSSDVSAPDPTSQEIRTPVITSDNQWKPLPHGPILRPAESKPKVQIPISDSLPEVVTAPPQQVLVEEKTKEGISEKVELNVETSYALGNSKEQGEKARITVTPAFSIATDTTTAPTTSTTELTTTTITTPTTTNMAETTTQRVSTTTERLEITTYFPEITTEPPTETTPVSEPESTDDNSGDNQSDIHDNSSGVRKILNETVILPPSKMSLSPIGGENVNTVLPVIQTLSPTEAPELEFNTLGNIVLSDLPAELGGNLKVSGCNVYGKYYRINDKVTVLSKKCSECVCSPDGIACSVTC